VLFNRQSFVGLVKRDYGSILVGRQYSPYYQNVGPSAVTGPPGGATGTHPGDDDGLDTDMRVTKAAAANGIDDPARYHEVSLEQTYTFSNYAYLYALQANTRSSGKTLGAAGSGIVDAVALEGENSSDSSGFGQRVTMVGLAVLL